MISSTPQSGDDRYSVEDILGIAIFGSDGLPKEYFITPENRNTAWVQLVFQALGLQAIVSDNLSLEGFKHTTIRTRDGDAVIIKTDSRFVALLLKRSCLQTELDIEASWVRWACEFEATQLRSHPHFRSV